MQTKNINDIIQQFDSLIPEEKEFAMKLMKKILTDSKRSALVKRAKEAEDNFKNGRVKSGTYKDLYKDLEG